MPFDLDPDDLALIRAQLGARSCELRSVMLDVDAFPGFLHHDDRPRLVEARSKAVELLDRWVALEPTMTSEIYSRLPDLVKHRSVSLSDTFLEAAMWADFNHPLIDLFGYPATDSRVFTAAPQLVPRLDESGLVDVEELDARPWGLHIGKYAFHYHQLMRRSFGARVHYGLIGLILRLSAEHNLTARFALDERRVQFKNEYREIHEMDRWHGRPLAEADLDDVTAVGETFHGDLEGGTSLFHPFAGLSVRWTADGDLKTVEIEEFIPVSESTGEWVFARYLHAIRDTTKRAFIHCDGAVKAFATSCYPRVAQDFKRRGKGDRYKKLFRIDGEFPTSAWSEVASMWFRGNDLINEYLDGSES